MSDMFGDFIEDPDEDDFDPYDETDSAPSLEPTNTLRDPRLMTDITGHDNIESDLLKAYHANKMPHALIFSGIKGIGKATMAYRLARFLLKEGSQDTGASLFGDEPLPAENFQISFEDNIYAKVASGGHPDLMTVERLFDDKKNKLKNGLEVDQIRKVAPFMRMTASNGKWRVVIIDDADTMNRSSQNGILKILEEPPANSIIILVTHNLGALIPTIRSRCRLINFHHLDDKTVQDLLTRGVGDEMPASDREMLANLSEGSIGRAMEYALEENLTTIRTLAETLNNWPNKGQNFNRLNIFALAELVSQNGKEHAFHTMRQNMSWVIEQMTKSAVTGQLNIPSPYDTPKLASIVQNNSLASWVEICDKLGEHFISADRGNLDKRQTTLDAFRIIEQSV